VEEKCPICETIRISGMDCANCGWEFTDLMDDDRELKIKECQDFLVSKKESDNFPDRKEVKETQGTPASDTKENPIGGEEELIQYESIDTEKDKNIAPIKEYANEVLLKSMETIANESINKVLDVFERKIAYDESKEKQIDNLHSELQEYKRDLIAKTNRPIVTGLIFMFGDMDKLIAKIDSTSEELSQEKLFKILRDIREDIEILLEQNGVGTFSEHDTKFNPRRQQVVKKVETHDEKLVGQVIETIRPGFEQGNEIIAKERVAVYVLEKITNDTEDAEENKDPQLNNKGSENE